MQLRGKCREDRTRENPRGGEEICRATDNRGGWAIEGCGVAGPDGVGQSHMVDKRHRQSLP